MKQITRQALLGIMLVVTFQTLPMIKKCNDLIVIFDPELSETVDGQKNAMAFVLVQALQEKVAPIIVSTNILENFCFWKGYHKKMLNVVKAEALATKSIALAWKKARELAGQLKESQRFDHLGGGGHFTVTLSATDIVDNDWHCYMHKQADLVLLIPKDYISRRVPNSVKDVNAQIKECGFRVAHLDKVAVLSPEALLRRIRTERIGASIDLIDAFESMFIVHKSVVNPLLRVSRLQQKEVSSKEQAAQEKIVEKKMAESERATWNIYMIGHGDAAYKKKALKKQYAQVLEELTVNRDNVAFWGRQPDSVYVYHQVEALQKQIVIAEKRIKKLTLLLQAAHDLPDEAVVPQAAVIAGISFDAFARLTNFFGTAIQASFLYYLTCFGGGYNQLFVKDVLQSLHVSFIAVSGGINEVPTTVFYPDLKLDESGTGLVMTHMRFFNFFTLLDSFFSEPISFATTKKMTHSLQKDPIAAIVRSVISVVDLNQDQPFVRIPAVGTFHALNVDKKMKFLTNSIVKSYELEGRAIDCTDSDIEIVLVYSEYIGVPLTINSRLNIISSMPCTIELSQHRVHMFEAITTDNALCSVIHHFVSFNSSHSTITFVIKKLACLDYEKSGLGVGDKQPIALENMVITITGELSEKGQVDTDLSIVFTFNGQTYSFAHHIEDLAHNSDDLFEFLSTSPATLTELKLTPAIIVEQLEKKIDKTVSVQKLCALKKTVLLQKLESLEKAINGKQLPALKLLYRYQKDLAQLQNQIGTLIIPTDLTEQERDMVYKRIAIIQEQYANAIAAAAVVSQ